MKDKQPLKSFAELTATGQATLLINGPNIYGMIAAPYSIEHHSDRYIFGQWTKWM